MLKIEVCEGQAGLALYVNDTRIAGPRHNGLMKTVLTGTYQAAARPAVTVKPLEWTPFPSGGEQALAVGLALYRVHHNSDDWYLVPDHMGKGGKAAAQADYERRILSALSAHPCTTSPIVDHGTANVSGKPVAWLFQHDETAMTTIVEVNPNLWAEAHPRWFCVGPLILAAPQSGASHDE